MNLNEDYFYIDGEKFYNLKYTHEQLVKLLKKLEEGKLLSEEQYKQLIEEIGLDNISTFDLNYYNLKNIPYIPVRLGDLYNDVGYDVKARVDQELKTLESLLDLESARIDEIKKELKNLNITEVLQQIQTAQDKADYIDKSIKDLNGVIFSFERSIESVQDKSNEIIREFEMLKNMQETDEIRLGNIFEIITIHTEDISKLLTYYQAEKEKLTNALSTIIVMQNSIDDLEDYHGIMNNIDIRISDIEAVLKLLHPDDVNFEGVLKLTSDIKALQEKDLEFQTFHDTMIKQIDDLSVLALNKFSTIENNIELLNTNIKEIENIISNHTSQLNKHEETLTNMESIIESKSLLIDKNIIDIDNLKLKSNELSSDIRTLYQEIEILTDKDSEHLEQLNYLKLKNEEIQNNILELNTITDNNSSEIIKLQNKIADDESLMNALDSRLTNAENTIDTNTENIESAKNNISILDDRLDDTELNIDNLDLNLSTLVDRVNTHFDENEKRIEEVDSSVDTLNQRISATEANVLTVQTRITEVEEFVNNSVEHIFITEAEYEALSEEDKNKEDVLYLITDGESVAIDFDSINDRVKTLEEVKHVSLEQYNTLLERVGQLEKALAELSPLEPDETEPDEESVPCTGISLTEETITLTLDNPTHQLKVILEPENTTDFIEWTSSNPEVAIVDDNGLVSINTETNSQGTSFIYAKCGTKTASCGVSVSL